MKKLSKYILIFLSIVFVPVVVFALNSQTIPNETVTAIPYGVLAGTGTGGGNFATDGWIGFATSTGLTVSSTIRATGNINSSSSITINGVSVSTTTPANPTATIGTNAVNGTATTYMRSDAAPALGPQFASSSIMFPFGNATTTAPDRYLKVRFPFAATAGSAHCDEYAAATSTMALYRVDTNGTTTAAATLLTSIACGINGTSTTTFASSSIPVGTWVMAVVSSTAGTPTLTQLNFEFKRN